MNEEQLETAVAEQGGLKLDRFRELPPGVQRVAIAALFLVVLVAVVLLREMIKTTENDSAVAESVLPAMEGNHG